MVTERHRVQVVQQRWGQCTNDRRAIRQEEEMKELDHAPVDCRPLQVFSRVCTYDEVTRHTSINSVSFAVISHH